MVESNVHSVLMWMAIFTVLFSVMRVLVEKYTKKKRTEADVIKIISRSLNCSEFNIFEFSAENWNISEGRIKHDFKDYMFYNSVPYYVRDYIRSTDKMDSIN